MDKTQNFDLNGSTQDGHFPVFVFLVLFLPVAALVFLSGVYFASRHTDDHVNEILLERGTVINK